MSESCSQAGMKICTKCKVLMPLDGFWRSGKSLQTQCKLCKKKYMAEYAASIPGYNRMVYQRHKASTRSRTLFRKYGITHEDYEKLLSEQNGRCAICRVEESTQFHGVLHVDHCHKSGAIRGLLCRGCNHVLGVVGDDPEILESAINYLSKASRQIGRK